jgi:protein disulfide-isomerase A1
MPALDVSKFASARLKSTDKFSREPSKALEAEWLAATSQTKTAMLSVDCKTEADLCQEQGVISYPAIRVFDGSEKAKRYKGPRKASA